MLIFRYKHNWKAYNWDKLHCERNFCYVITVSMQFLGVKSALILISFNWSFFQEITQISFSFWEQMNYSKENSISIWFIIAFRAYFNVNFTILSHSSLHHSNKFTFLRLKRLYFHFIEKIHCFLISQKDDVFSLFINLYFFHSQLSFHHWEFLLESKKIHFLLYFPH